MRLERIQRSRSPRRTVTEHVELQLPNPGVPDLTAAEELVERAERIIREVEKER